MVHPDPDLLALVPLFRGLTQDERVKLAHWFEVQDFQPGRVPLRKDQAGYAFFVLVKGQARAERDGKVLEVLEPGSVFGEMAFFAAEGRRSATIAHDGPVRVLSMFGTYFRQMQMEMPEVAARLEQLFSERSARMRASEGQGK